MNTKLIYLLVRLLLANEERTTKDQEVCAGKEFERALKDRLEATICRSQRVILDCSVLRLQTRVF